MLIYGINAMSPMDGPSRMGPPSAVDMSSEIMTAKDADGDGAFSRSEANLSKETFGGIDTNGDGAISQNELISKLTEKLEEMKEKMDCVASDGIGQILRICCASVIDDFERICSHDKTETVSGSRQS